MLRIILSILFCCLLSNPAWALPKAVHFDLVVQIRDLQRQDISVYLRPGQTLPIALEGNVQVELSVLAINGYESRTRIRFLDTSSGSPVEAQSMSTQSKSFQREYTFAYCDKHAYLWPTANDVAPLSCDRIDKAQSVQPPSVWTPLGHRQNGCSWAIDKSRTSPYEQYLKGEFLSQCPSPSSPGAVMRYRYQVLVDCWEGTTATTRIDLLTPDGSETPVMVRRDAKEFDFRPLLAASSGLAQARAVCKLEPPFQRSEKPVRPAKTAR